MKNYYILKNLCSKIYLAGTGNFWYEEKEIGNDKSLKYVFLSVIMFFIYLLLTVLEIMAAMYGDLPKVEKSDSVTFAVSHTIVMIKIFSVMYNRKIVKELNCKMVKICEPYEDEALENFRIIKINVWAYFISVYGSAACFIYEGVRKMLTGSHFITVVTYWPYYEDNSLPAIVFRFFTTIVLCVMMMTMISIDSFVMVTLIMYKYKFITLRRYLESLREEFDRNNYVGNEELAADRLQSGLIEGIVMHRELLCLSKDIDRAFGTVMACQVCQSSGSAVSLLLQIALSNDLTFVVGMKILLFVAALFFLLALFLCNAGEITYQASLISDAIFYCGWHASAWRRDLRRLVLLSSACAQRPLVMKAFKMLELTYGTFLLVLTNGDLVKIGNGLEDTRSQITILTQMSKGGLHYSGALRELYGTFLQVVRSTYSVFALFYAQNK